MLKLQMPSKQREIPLNGRINLRAPHPASDTRLEVLVPRIPDLDEFRFEQRHGTWYAEKNGVATHYYWRGPENGHGFGGQHIDIRTTADEKVTLKGPWSTRAGVVNAEGFGPCVDVSLTDNPEVFARGYTFTAGSITLDLAEVICQIIGNVKMVRRIDDGDIYYEATMREDA
jgi:hypothetical protein